MFDPHRRPTPRAVDPAAEVARVRRENAARFIAARNVPWSVEALLARATEVGDERAAAEAVQAKRDSLTKAQKSGRAQRRIDGAGEVIPPHPRPVDIPANNNCSKSSASSISAKAAAAVRSGGVS